MSGGERVRLQGRAQVRTIEGHGVDASRQTRHTSGASSGSTSGRHTATVCVALSTIFDVHAYDQRWRLKGCVGGCSVVELKSSSVQSTKFHRFGLIYLFLNKY